MATKRVPQAGMAIGPDEQAPTFEEHEKLLKDEREKISALLKTTAGEVLLRHLSRRYDGPLVARVEGVGVDSIQTNINIGAREVYVYLRDLRGQGNSQ